MTSLGVPAIIIPVMFSSLTYKRRFIFNQSYAIIFIIITGRQMIHVKIRSVAERGIIPQSEPQPAPKQM